jgi:hypothetical protein
VWEGWKAGFLAFHAFHTLSFPWPALETRVAQSNPAKAVLSAGTACPNRLDERIGENTLIDDPWKIAGVNGVFGDLSWRLSARIACGV